MSRYFGPSSATHVSRLERALLSPSAMKKLFLALACVLVGSASGQAITYNLSPTPANLWSLDHFKYYTWGIDWSIPEGETITGATLTFNDIWNWRAEENFLHIHILDHAKLGARIRTDNQGGGDYFASTAFARKGIDHVKIGTWSDPLGGLSANAVDLVFNFDMAQLNALASFIGTSGPNDRWGNFGFGFDPDCHYWNTGIQFEIRTIRANNNVPEAGGTALLLGVSVASMAALRRRFVA